MKAVTAYLWKNVSLIFLRCMTLCCPEVWSCLYHACETLKGHSFFMGRGGGGFWGGHPKIFELKRGAIPNIEKDGGSCRYLYWLEGSTQGKIGGVMQNFSEIIEKPPHSYP